MYQSELPNRLLRTTLIAPMSREQKAQNYSQINGNTLAMNVTKGENEKRI